MRRLFLKNNKKNDQINAIEIDDDSSSEVIQEKDESERKVMEYEQVVEK